MMTTEFTLLFLTAITLAFIHTLSGPDHYLPFIVISKARKWSLSKTIQFTILCGLGHVGSSILIGLIGIFFGLALPNLVNFESVRGSVISWAFTAFGLVYFVCSIYRVLRSRPHTHVHVHPTGGKHLHEHHHQADHVHVHVEEEEKVSITPWVLFTIFVFGPCEPLIPIVMFPAAKHNYFELFVVTSAFCLVTILTMVVTVVIAVLGIRLVPMKLFEKYSHVMAASTILLCGLGMVFLGL